MAKVEIKMGEIGGGGGGYETLYDSGSKACTVNTWYSTGIDVSSGDFLAMVFGVEGSVVTGYTGAAIIKDGAFIQKGYYLVNLRINSGVLEFQNTYAGSPTLQCYVFK